MNLVTSSNATIALTTCIVGLLLTLPHTNLRAAVRYAVFALWPSRDTSSPEQRPEVMIPVPEAEAELLDGFSGSAQVGQLVDA